MYERISTLRAAVPEIDMEVHTHNDLGMATANALAGIRAGARFVNTTVNGLGERAGNAAIEETVMALHQLYGKTTGIAVDHFPVGPSSRQRPGTVPGRGQGGGAPHLGPARRALGGRRGPARRRNGAPARGIRPCR